MSGPAALLTRLQTPDYEKITIGIDYALTFVAPKPDPDAPAWGSG